MIYLIKVCNKLRVINNKLNRKLEIVQQNKHCSINKFQKINLLFQLLFKLLPRINKRKIKFFLLMKMNLLSKMNKMKKKFFFSNSIY